jgi:hypothetical protein
MAPRKAVHAPACVRWARATSLARAPSSRRRGPSSDRSHSIPAAEGSSGRRVVDTGHQLTTAGHRTRAADARVVTSITVLGRRPRPQCTYSAVSRRWAPDQVRPTDGRPEAGCGQAAPVASSQSPTTVHSTAGHGAGPRHRLQGRSSPCRRREPSGPFPTKLSQILQRASTAAICGRGVRMFGR